MKFYKTVLSLACLALGITAATAATLEEAFTATGPSDDACNPSPKAANFLTTDSTVWLYVAASNGAAGDVLTVDWVEPNGNMYYTTTFEPLPTAGNYCFDDYMDVAGQSAAQYPGTWTIRGHWNGANFFSLTFTLSTPGGTGATPSINSGGIMNAASYTPASMPAGALARGSFFSIFGTNLGPAQYQSQSGYPLPTNLGGASVQITGGGKTVNAYLVFVSAGQINAILPSNAPTGDVQVVVTYQGVASQGSPAKVMDTNFGIFSLANGRGPGIIQNYVSGSQLPLNTRSATAMPGQTEIMLGTGLGPISAPDNNTPPVGNLTVPVQVLVGGKVAAVSYSGRMPGVAGVDQINFQVPADVPTGCYVPVEVRAGSMYSNIVTISIEAQGQPCSDPMNPFSPLVSGGGKGGAIFLVRVNAHAQIDPSQAPMDLALDLGVAAFEDNTGKGDMGFNPLFSLPPVGTCSAYAGGLDLSSLLSNPSSVAGSTGLLGTDLDAGPSISVTGPKGNAIQLNHLDTTNNTGPYIGLLGGSIPLLTDTSLPPFLDPGTFTISGSGGKDVGPFRASVTIGAPITWTNQMTTVDRSQNLTFTWTGGDSSKLVLIAGAGADETSKVAGGFFCFVPSAPGSYTVPASVLGNLPGSSGSSVLGAVIIGSFPTNYAKFTASGLDSGLAFNATLYLTTVNIQ
ncbi:MAG TPA: hypothetical protein VMH05_15185 [Bryobacteraceae bacterium]|nr:hypothetical protein [Bryobacteraceae bacterium]